MWTVIYIAQSEKVAEQITERLATEGFLAKIRGSNVSRQQFEIVVPETELEEVQEVLNDILHGH